MMCTILYEFHNNCNYDRIIKWFSFLPSTTLTEFRHGHEINHEYYEDNPMLPSVLEENIYVLSARMGRHILCYFLFRTRKTLRRWSRTNACHSTSISRRGAQNQRRTDRNEERSSSQVRHDEVVFNYFFDIALVISIL